MQVPRPPGPLQGPLGKLGQHCPVLAAMSGSIFRSVAPMYHLNMQTQNQLTTHSLLCSPRQVTRCSTKQNKCISELPKIGQIGYEQHLDTITSSGLYRQGKSYSQAADGLGWPALTPRSLALPPAMHGMHLQPACSPATMGKACVCRV